MNIGKGITNSKETEIQNLIENQKLDILVLQETEWRNDSGIFQIEGYKTILPKQAKDQTIIRAMMLIKEDIEFKTREDLMTTEIPSIWIEIQVDPKQKILVNGIYREWNNLREEDSNSIPKMKE